MATKKKIFKDNFTERVMCGSHTFGEKNTLQPPPAMGAIFGSPDIGDKSKSKTRLQKFSNGKA